MKKKRAFFFFLFLLLLSFVLPVPLSHASENGVKENAESTKGDVEDSLLKDFNDILPDAAKEALGADTLDTDALTETVGFRYIFSLLADSFSTALSENKGTLSKLLGITLTFCAIALLSGFFGKMRFAEIFFSAAPALLFYKMLLPVSARVFSFVTDLSLFSSLAAPLYATVFSSAGALNSAGAASGGFAVFVGVLEGIVGGVLSPILKILFILSLLSPLSANSTTKEIEKRVRAAYIWIISLVAVLLCASLAFESSLAASADSVAIRTVKFTVGQSIPLVGSSISAMLGTLSSSLSLVKSAFGAGCLIVLLSLLLPVLAELLSVRLTLSLCSFISNAMGADSMGTVCDRYRGIFDLMLAAVAITGAMFLVLVGILSKGLSL